MDLAAALDGYKAFPASPEYDELYKWQIAKTVQDNWDLEAALKEIYDTERHLLYVACTRAREHLLVTSAEPESEFWMTLDTEARRR